jgi:DNA-binding transcriptional LysR family regulator
MDHLQAIRIFTRVVETGGFNRAAMSLDMPNATVSKWVKSLETHLGVKLLERSTRSVSVTTDGAAYYERTRHLLSELDDIEATLGRSQGNPKGPLRVDTGGAPASGIIVPNLPIFCARYPDIQVRLSVTDRTVDLLSQNIDCAIRSTADDPNLVTHQIASLAWTTCASPGFFAKHAKPKHPHDIIGRNIPVVGYFSASTGLTQPLQFRRKGEEVILAQPRHDVLVSESNAHLATALNGLGLVHTLDFMVRPSISKGDLVPVLEQWRPAPLPIYIVYPPSKRYSTKVRVFVDWISGVFGNL